jgi:hypothetical protein
MKNIWITLILVAILPATIAETLDYYCPSMVRTNEPFAIWADYQDSNNTDIPGATVNVTNITTGSYPLIYQAGRYSEDFQIANALIWYATISASAPSYAPLTANCTIAVEEPFGFTIRIWEEVEFTNSSGISQRNYNKQLTDPYINDFAWIIAKNNDLNASGAYQYCNFPFKTGQNVWAITMPNYIGNKPSEDALKGIKDLLSGGLVGCDNYWYHSHYEDGVAILQLPVAGNYSLYFVEGPVEWENSVSPPKIERSDLFMYLGEITIPDKQDYTIDFWVAHSELNFWGSLSDEVFLFMLTLFPIILFIFLVMAGMPIAFAGMIALGWNVIWMVLNTVF